MFLLISVCSAAFILPEIALAQPCSIEISKEAEGAGANEVFQFEVVSGQGTTGFKLVNGGSIVLQVDPQFPVDLVELPAKGWRLDLPLCRGNGFASNGIPGGVRMFCLGNGGGEGSCRFINVFDQTSDIPTLSEWGMIAAAAGLVLIGVFFAVKRKKAQAV